jgi:hypothetical protein
MFCTNFSLKKRQKSVRSRKIKGESSSAQKDMPKGSLLPVINKILTAPR